MFDLSSLAYQVHTSLRQSSPSVKRTHVQEVISALLGFQTYAAYHVQGSPGFDELANAEHVILQAELAVQRATGLGLSASDAELLVDETTRQMKAASPASGPRVHASTDDFNDDFLRPYMEAEALDSGEVSSEMASTNAYLSEVSVEDIVPDCEILDARDAWSLVGTGVVDMDQDPEKPFSGDTVNITVHVVFDLVGRIGLIRADTEVSASLADSWYDDGYDEKVTP